MRTISDVRQEIADLQRFARAYEHLQPTLPSHDGTLGYRADGGVQANRWFLEEGMRLSEQLWDTLRAELQEQRADSSVAAFEAADDEPGGCEDEVGGSDE